MRVISTPIAGSGLTRIGVQESSSSRWFAPVPASPGEWRARAGRIRDALVHEDWLAVLDSGFDASGPAAGRLERASSSGFAVTTGQQPGLFGGPLYTWWKALTALALADRLERETGLPVVPIFWAATDDSDYAEAASTVIATATGFEELTLPPHADSSISLARVSLGDVSSQFERLAAATGSAPNRGILEILRQTYSGSHTTLGSAYVALLREVLGPLGIAVIDASHPAVRAASLPVLHDALAKEAGIEASLMSRSDELKAMKLSPQVKLVRGRTLVFSEGNGQRDRIRSVDAADMADAASADTSDLGPNVLLRPIVERAILPTVAYVGGPAEIAYFAQVTAVADALNTPAPIVVRRWSGMVVEPRIERILSRYAVDVADLRDPHAVETRLARESLPSGLVDHIADFRKSVADSMSALSEADGAGLVPPAVLDGVTGNIGHRLDRLERRYIAAVKRDGNEALREIAIARGALFPGGSPQERSLNGIPLFARYGDDLMAAVMPEIRTHADSI